MLKTFSAETAVAKHSMNLGKFDGAPIVANYATESIVDFSEYLTDTVRYFRSMARYDADVSYVTIMTRIDRDHRAITIVRDIEGNVTVTG